MKEKCIKGNYIAFILMNADINLNRDYSLRISIKLYNLIFKTAAALVQKKLIITIFDIYSDGFVL